MKNKEKAVNDYMVMIVRSWTWARLTHDERKAFADVVGDYQRQGEIKGTYDARWRIMMMLYDSFLVGCGYRGFTFREEETA